MNAPRKPQVRMHYRKLGKVRFISHRDMARCWERAVRRARMPIAYTEGFSPRPKMSFGLALPTTFESVAEFIDISLEEPVPLPGLPEVLSECLPEGVDVVDIVSLDQKVESLQQAVVSSEWLLNVLDEVDKVEQWVQQVLDKDEIPITRERKGKERVDDIRPAILSLEVQGADRGADILADLATQPRALRPAELLGALDAEFELLVGRRLNQLIASDGARQDPLSVGAASAPRREVCAS